MTSNDRCNGLSSPAHALLRCRWPILAAYSVALLLTLATVLLRQRWAVSFGERPLLMLFMFPIMISAWLGGVGPGLAATLLAAVSTDYLFIPPFDSFGIAAPYDLLQWCMLLANGVLASFLSESLHRSRQRETARWRQLNLTQAELQRYEQIVATSGDMLAFVDKERRLQVVNPAYSALFGAAPADLKQQPLVEVLGEANYALIAPYLDRALAGDNQRFIAEPAFPDGKQRTLDAEYRPYRQDGEVQGVVVYLRDITERKRSETALKESEERLNLFIKHAPASLAMFDGQMRYLAASRRWIDDFCLGDQPILGRSHYEIFPEIPQRWKDVHQRALAGETIRANEDHFERNDGSEQWLRWEVLPWHNNDGAVGGIVIFSEDISGQKRAEEEIHRLNTDLEKRVEERTAELTAANRELDSFAYAVSHDLRAPLRAMSGFSQALAEDYGELLQGEAKVYLEQISLASRKMGELIDGLLLLSRSTRGEMRHDEVDISELSQRLLAEMAHNDPQRRVDAEIEAGLRARGDARMIEMVMRNLLGNAWKYTAKTVSASIRVYADAACASRLCVADNGAGFDMAHANRLFQPFQRLHRQDEFPGIGIGLATVQRIVHRHGGAIEARGEPGKGAVFCFTLPAMPHE